MAAKTPSSVIPLSNGNGVKLTLASFADIDTGDTWTSKINGVLTVVPIDKTGTTTAGLAASSTAAGVVTFTTITDNKAVDLLVYSR